MAISPKQALGTKMEQESAAIAALEGQIDNALTQNYTGRGSVTFNANMFPNEFVRSEVVKRFEAVGWEVKYHNDQRDGDYLEFKAKVNAESYYGK